jgi:hypothetical protein
MRQPIQLSAFVALSFVAMLMVACADPRPAPRIQWSPMPIPEIKAVAGKWEGLLKRLPRARQDDWVELTITEDGRYKFASYRLSGAFKGSGSTTLQDGILREVSEAGTITFTLYQANGQRMLKADGTTSDGLRYIADMTPAKTKTKQ